MKAARSAHPLRGILMIMAAVAMFTVMDAIAKYLSRYYPVALIVWARYAFHLLLMVTALGPRLGLGLCRTSRPGMQILRGAVLAGATLMFINAIKRMPLAEASSITFVAPVLVTLLAVLILKERVDLSRWLAVGAGFIGVLFVIRPGSGVFTWVSLLPLATACFFAIYQILNRHMAGLESPYVSIFYAGLVGTVVMTFGLPAVWVAPQNALHAFLFVVIGVIGGLSHLILIKAYDYASASRLAPFSYTQLIWVTLMGYLVFDDFPDHWSLFGMAVIMLSGIYIATHQTLSGRK